MVIRTWKIKIKNGNAANETFRQWFNDYKYAYNKAHWLQKNSTADYSGPWEGFPSDYKIEERNWYQHETGYSDKDLRNLITPKEVNTRIPWHLETPKDIRAEGVFEYCSNLKAARTNTRNGNIRCFQMNYMKKKAKHNRFCFGLPGSAIKVKETTRKYDSRKRITIYSTYTNGFEFHLSKPLPKDAIENGYLKREHKIFFDGITYYLLVVVDREIILNTPLIRRNFVAIDPGIRKMVTTWDIKNRSYHFGTGKSIQIKQLLKKRSVAQSNGNKKDYIKIEIRIKNLMNELHHKTSTFICKRYRKIILPELNVNQLIKKVNSREYRKAMLRMKLCEFNNLMKAKAELYNSQLVSNVDGVTEAYSSRLCSNCKFVNPKCSKEWKRCRNCKFEVDRDINGAKNIYFMNVHLF